MATTLRAVLNAFEQAERPLSVKQLAADLDIPSAMLEGMIDFWVRKGRLRESGGMADCGTCGHGDHCPLVIKMPRRFELASEGVTLAGPPPCPACSTCH